MSTGYRPPSSEPQGRWARHIHATRKSRGWSQTKGFEQTRALLNLSEKSRSAYIGLDMGERQPTDAEAEALASVYGWPDEEEVPAPPPNDAVAAALDRLGDRLVAAIEAQGQAQARSLDTLAELLGGALSQLAASLERTPDGSAGQLEAPQGGR